MGRVAAAFLQAEVTTLAWLHLLLLDLFQARCAPLSLIAIRTHYVQKEMLLSGFVHTAFPCKHGQSRL